MTFQSSTKKNNYQKKKRSPRKISERYLHNAALAYLGRFASSSENLRRILHRKIERSCKHHGEPTIEEAHKLTDNLIERFSQNGLLDDTAYAKGMVTSLRRRGLSKRGIFAKLQQKGLNPSQIEEALSIIDEEIAYESGLDNPELVAGFQLARRRKLGPYRLKDRAERAEKDLAAMARSGFSYDIAKKVIFTEVEDLEDYIF